MTDTMNFAEPGGGIPEANTARSQVLSVLYVDDEPLLLDVCKLYLEQCSDISVSVSSSVENALTLLEITTFDVIISDYQMPGTDGIGFLKILKEMRCSIPFILFTGRMREEVIAEAMNNGAMFYIPKGGYSRSPFAELNKKIHEAFRRSLAEKNANRENVNNDQIMVQHAF
jgi:DNA-binding NtrC family response regulator